MFYFSVLNTNVWKRPWAMSEIKSQRWQCDTLCKLEFDELCDMSFVQSANSIICINHHHCAVPSHLHLRLKCALCFPLCSCPCSLGKKVRMQDEGNANLKNLYRKFWILKPWTCFICHLFILYIYSIYFLNPLAALCHVIFLNVIFKDVWLRRKYEAIYPEFNGAGMPLTHFIVHYMKGQGHRVDICCAPSGKEPLL